MHRAGIAVALLAYASFASAEWSAPSRDPAEIMVARSAPTGGLRYDVLGTIEVVGDDCGPAEMRAGAWEKYGSKVNAVIDFARERLGSSDRCVGTAVRLILPDNPGNPTPNTAPNLSDGSLSPGKLRE